MITAERLITLLIRGKFLLEGIWKLLIFQIWQAQYFAGVLKFKSSWIVPRLMMLAAGLDPESDLKEIIDVGSEQKIIAGLYNGTCESGATYLDARIDFSDDFFGLFGIVDQLTQTLQIPFASITFSSDLTTDVQDELEADIFLS